MTVQLQSKFSLRLGLRVAVGRSLPDCSEGKPVECHLFGHIGLHAYQTSNSSRSGHPRLRLGGAYYRSESSYRYKRSFQLGNQNFNSIYLKAKTFSASFALKYGCRL